MLRGCRTAEEVRYARGKGTRAPFLLSDPLSPARTLRPAREAPGALEVLG